MNTSPKRKFWVIFAVAVFVALSGVFSLQIKSVNALLDDARVFVIIRRFQTNIIEKTPAGLYYSILFTKHGDEIIQLLESSPEHAEATFSVVKMFAPGFDALMDGKGDDIRITAEQIHRLRVEVDWLASVGSQILREDIEKEQRRLPLVNFIGMTMSEALDYVNTNSSPSLTMELAATLATETPNPTPIPQCMAGFDSDCLREPLLVPNADGQWAYHVLNGIYFEYPSKWRVEGMMDSLSLLPTPDSPESSSVGPVYLFAWNPQGQLDVPYDPLTYPQTELYRSIPTWNRLVPLPDFTGSVAVWVNSPDTEFIYVSAIFYLPSIPTILEARMTFKNDPTNVSLYDPDLFQEQYPNFRHIVESFRFWEP